MRPPWRTLLCFATALLPIASAFAPQLTAQSKYIHETTDPYNGRHMLFLEVGTRTCPGDPSPREHDPEVHILFTATENSDQTVSYFITPELDHGYTLNLRANGTMDALIDGSVTAFQTALGSTVITNYDAGRSYLHETIPFSASPADLARIAEAQMFQFRVNGSHRMVQRCTDAKRLRDLSEFLEAAADYAPHAPAGAPNLLQQPQPAPESPDATAPLLHYSVGGIATYACAGTKAAPEPEKAAPEPQIVQLTLLAEQHSDHTVKYFIVADLTGGTPLRLRNRGTLELTLDGAAETFRTPHGSTLDTVTAPDGSTVPHETIPFHVDRRNIVALGHASTVQFRIASRDTSLQRCTDATHLHEVDPFLTAAARLYDHPVAELRKP